MVDAYLFHTCLQFAFIVAIVGTVLVIDMVRRNPPLD